MGLKKGIVQTLPDTQELDRVAVPQPVLYDIVRALRVFVAGNIGEADIVLFVLRLDRDFFAQHLDLRHHCLPPFDPC